jgi:hypothetical protein
VVIALLVLAGLGASSASALGGTLDRIQRQLAVPLALFRSVTAADQTVVVGGGEDAALIPCYLPPCPVYTCSPRALFPRVVRLHQAAQCARHAVLWAPLSSLLVPDAPPRPRDGPTARRRARGRRDQTDRRPPERPRETPRRRPRRSTAGQTISPQQEKRRSRAVAWVAVNRPA